MAPIQLQTMIVSGSNLWTVERSVVVPFLLDSRQPFCMSARFRTLIGMPDSAYYNGMPNLIPFSILCLSLHIHTFKEMDIPFSAVDMGFEVKSEPFPSEGRSCCISLILEKVIVDGFSFPKAIPEPIFLEEGSLQFTRFVV